MDKFRALTIYAKSLLRHRQGSGELLDCNHIFYEAYRSIIKNGWEEEAKEFFKEESENAKKDLFSLEDEYNSYIQQGVRDSKKEKHFNNRFHKLGINGREEEIIKYKVSHNGESPSRKALNEIMTKRKEEDERNALAFLECQRKIYNGLYVDQDKLAEATSKLIEHGLYDIVVKIIPAYVNCYNAEELIEGYDSQFKLKLY